MKHTRPEILKVYYVLGFEKYFMLEWKTVRQIDKLQGPSINKETQNLHTQGFCLILFSLF